MVNVHQAKTELSRLLARVEQGETIIISRAGKPVAKLVPIAPEDTQPRRPGLWEGKVWIADDFNRLPTDIENSFYGE